MQNIFYKTFFLILFLASFGVANEKVSLQLQWKYQFQFAGYIMAKEKGFYDEVGLDVEIREWDYGIDTVDKVINQESTFSVVRSTAFLDNSNKNDILFLAAIFQSSPLVLLADKSSGIKTFQDLKNKKLMSTTDLSTDASLLSMFFSQNLTFKDMNVIKQTFNVEDIKNGYADVMAAYISNEPFVLKQLGGEPVIFNPKEYGFDFYSDILLTNRKTLKQNPELVKKFTASSLKGWEYAFSNIEETAELIHKKYNSLNKSKEALIYEGTELEKLAYDGTDALGSIHKEKLERIYDIYKLFGLSNTKIFFDDSVYTINDTKKEFTQIEKEYIQQSKPIKVCTNPNWAPIEFNDSKGNPNGISIDILKLSLEKANLSYQFIPTQSWGESQQFLKEKKCDILPAAIKTTDRSKYANFTKPHSSYDLAIITKNNKPLVNNFENILHKTIARKKDSGLVSVLKEKYPDIKMIETKGYKEAFETVANGKAYYTIATLPVLAYYKNIFNFDNLQIAGYTGMKYELSMAVRDDDIILLNILDKALSNISNESKNIINEKWFSKPYERKMDTTMFIYMVLILGVLALFFIYKQYMLKKSLNEFDELINATIEGIVIFKENICIDVNQSLVDILGYDSKEEIIGKEVLSFVPNEYLKLAKLKLSKENITPFEFYALKKENTTIPVLIKGHYIRRKKYKLISIVDISQLKLQEEQLLQQAKLVSMGEMIGNIAHQWRQPLSVISTSATGIKIQKEYGVLDDKFLFQACDAIDHNVQYLSNTIDDFRNFIKGERIKGKFSAKELLESLLNLIEPSAKTHNITIIHDAVDSLIIDGYKNELNQCFLNIYNNAKDVLLENNMEAKLLFISISAKENHIEITFKDNGGGISNEVLPKIFDPYFTTKHQSQGTGLGLNMTYNLITKGMHGAIFASNEIFEYQNHSYSGAKFTITLPKE